MTSEWHTAFAPATVANLGPGFDVLGLALDSAMGLQDRCAVRLLPPGELRLEIEGDGGRLPREPAANSATVVAAAVVKRAGSDAGLHVRLTKGLPLGSGLGSSAASSASAAMATNAALGSPLSLRELFGPARQGEAVAAGTPHPDNVIPALIGGIVLMVEDTVHGLDVVHLPVPDGLYVAVVIPELVVFTADARAVLPARVPMTDAITNVGRLGLFVSALYDGDLTRLGRATGDALHEPYRIGLVPGYERARDAAVLAGALGVGLSGSGPAMFALAEGREAAEACGRALASGFQESGTAARWAAGRVASPRPW